MIKNTIVISDIHAGCGLGLMPPKVTLDTGQVLHHSRLQKSLWHWWEEFWNVWVPKVTKGDEYNFVFNGDAIDGRHHGATTQITHNLSDQAKIAYEILAPVREKANKFYFIRGTESHVGPSGEDEERLAERLDAKPRDGMFSRYEMWYRMAGCLIHFTHHIGGTGSSSYESTGVYKELVEMFNEAGRWRDEPPDVVVRSHRHRQFEIRVATEKGYGIPLVTPGWQLKTPYVYRLPSGRAGTPQCGGYLIRTGDEEVYTRFKVFKISRPREETA